MLTRSLSIPVTGGPNADIYYNGDGSGGTYGPNYDLSEQWVNLEIGMLLYNQLTNWVVYFTRDQQDPDPAPTPLDRANFANQILNQNPDDVFIFVSIHHNSSDDNPGANIQGTETLWCNLNKTENEYGDPVPDYEKRVLADAIQPELVLAFGYANRGVKEDSTANPAKGHLTVLSQTEMIAALTEASFLDTYDEEWSMLYPNHRLDEATAIYTGIYAYAATIEIDPYYCIFPPETPQNLSEYAQYSNGVMINWSQSARASYYEVHRSITSGFNPSSETLIGTPYTTIYFDDTVIEPNQYYYKVRSVSDCGGPEFDLYSGFSSELPVYYDIAPVAPTNLTWSNSNGHPHLSWTANVELDVIGYKVYRNLFGCGQNCGAYTNIATVNGRTNTNYTDSQVNIARPRFAINEAYYYVKAIDSSNESEKSNTVSVPTNQAEKTQVSYVPLQYHVFPNYPNPFNSTTVFRYDLPEDSYVDSKIINITGDEVITLIKFFETAGSKYIKWDGKDSFGNSVSSGMYIHVFTARSSQSEKTFYNSSKILLLR